jgi:hypothetical protein
MSDWIGLGVFLLVLAGAIAGLSLLGKERPPMTEEEFQQRAAEGRGTTAGMANALQKVYDPQAARGTEVVRELRAGRFDKKRKRGDDDPHDETDERDF